MARKKRNRSTANEPPARHSIAPARPWGAFEFSILCALLLGTLAIYAQVVTHEFVNFDDDRYIMRNPMVAMGLTPQGIAWAFTTFYAANWHPLTWLSHMLDSQLFGLNAGGHLLVNALIHSCNASFVFLFFRRVTGALWRSALIAALFALHPLHVESVAWAAERKDTLSAFFGLLCLLAYARYVEKPAWPWSALVAGTLALGLMSKPMLVSWPFLFLLLDYWPLRRLKWQPGDGGARFFRAWGPLLREKWPFFLLIVPSIVVTQLAQARGGSVADLATAPLSLRIANALVSYAKYLWRTFWPADLAIYYPFPVAGVPGWQLAGALVLLAAISALALREARRAPYLLVGWLWFVGSLIPVIGLVQVGSQAMADRYHYIPSIGLFAAIIFGLGDLARAVRVKRSALALVAGAALLALATATALQIRWWRTSVTLFERAVAVTSDNVVARYNLACALYEKQEYDAAIAQFAETVRLKPNHLRALVNMGMAYRQKGKPAEAIPLYERAHALDPRSMKAHFQRGLAFADLGKNEEAIAAFSEAVELAPDDFDVRMELALILTRQGRPAAAVPHLQEAVRIHPGNAEARNNLGLVLLLSGRAEESMPHFSEALRLKPDLANARQNLERAQREAAARPR